MLVHGYLPPVFLMMYNGNLSLPQQRRYEYSLKVAYKLASEKLRKMDIGEVCRRSGAVYCTKDKTELCLTFLKHKYIIKLPEIELTSIDGKEQESLTLREKVLILHYLISEHVIPVTGKSISFKELPEGMVYYPTFAKRTIDPFVKEFGGNPEGLIKAALKIGGREAKYGDVSVSIDSFPFITIVLVLWKGDAEFPPAGSIMFDAGIAGYMSTEDITVLCETVVWKLVKASNK